MSFLTRGKSTSIWRVDTAAPFVLLGGGPPGKQKHVTEPALTGRFLHEQQGFNDAGQEGQPDNRFDRFEGLSSSYIYIYGSFYVVLMKGN